LADELTFLEGKIQVRCRQCAKINAIPIERTQEKPSCGSCHAPLPTIDQPIKLSDSNFDDFIRHTRLPVLIDFWAPWCGPCRMMGPTVERFAKRRAGQVLVAKLDTQENRQIPGKLGIQSIPTLIAFRGGQEFARQVGLVQEAMLDNLLG
jgi:thioredoxin 2